MLAESAPNGESPLIKQAVGVVQRAESEGVQLRLVGGIAVALHSPSARHRDLQRDYADIDFVSGTDSGGKLDLIFSELGYEPDKRFNGLNGKTRRLYFSADGTRQIDIFVRSFQMCHELPLADRLDVDSPTIPLAELFLSKAQIVELNHKDTLDLFAMLVDHPVGPGDEETLNIDQISSLCAKDWGLWRTVTWTLDRLEAILAADLGEINVDLIRSRIESLREGIEAASKSMRWKARARVGDRLQWYELPEDPRRKVG